jgi:hypothetical protein
MKIRICPYCKKEFTPSRYHPEQAICSSIECQRRRRTDYHRRKRTTDPEYRETCRNSQEQWRKENPDYMRLYLQRRRDKIRLNTKTSSVIKSSRILVLLKSKAEIDPCPSEASTWLLSPCGSVSEKNIFAHAKVIVLQGVLYTAGKF